MTSLKYVFALCLTALLALDANATWSIIIIDPKTKEIGIAGASCTYSVYGIGGIIPGKGAVVVQAMSNKAALHKGLKMVLADASPEEILKTIRDPEFDPEEQQYAIVCIRDIGVPQTYTGISTNSARGSVSAKGISVQGNTLSNTIMLQKILDVAVKAQKASLPIQDVLMLALEAGAEYGGDKRCGERKASSAFLTVARPDDDRQKPTINITYNQTDQTTNAVLALRRKFDSWKKASVIN